MTVHLYSELKCDHPGCKAHWPSQGFNLHYPGNGQYARRVAAKVGWKYSSVQGDYCPIHEIPTSHTVLSEREYSLVDLKRFPPGLKHQGKWQCPVPDCCSIGYHDPLSLLQNHANKPHIRCDRCGWVGISLVKHKAARERAGLPEC